jgi:dihydrofolate reductase
MKVILDLAISADGFIAKPDGNSDWVAPSTEELFKKRTREAGCLVVGRRTYEQYRGSIYPVDGALNIVLTNNSEGLDVSVVSATSPEETLAIAKENGCSGVLIAGGASVSGAFLKAGLINEIFFSVHPLLLTQGMKPFGDIEVNSEMTLVDTKELEGGIIQLHYEVLR